MIDFKKIKLKSTNFKKYGKEYFTQTDKYKENCTIWHAIKKYFKGN
jgi:hypothetical protein